MKIFNSHKYIFIIYLPHHSYTLCSLRPSPVAPSTVCGQLSPITATKSHPESPTLLHSPLPILSSLRPWDPPKESPEPSSPNPSFWISKPPPRTLLVGMCVHAMVIETKRGEETHLNLKENLLVAQLRKESEIGVHQVFVCVFRVPPLLFGAFLVQYCVCLLC